MTIRSWLFLSVFTLPLFVSLDTSSIWDSNEAFYVQTPKEMVETSDWIVPHFNDQVRLNKPPFSYWLVATFYSFFGVSVFWERLLTATCALASILAVLNLGNHLFSIRIAILASGIFATTFRFLILSRRSLIEILLLALLLWSLVFFLKWTRSPRSIYLYSGSLMLALAFLTKGPIAMLALIIFGIYLVIFRKTKVLKTSSLITALLLFLVVAGSWFIALGIEFGWSPVWEFFLIENLGRYTSIDYGPQRGFFYYPIVFLGDFLPWSLFFVLSLLYWLLGVRKRQGKKARQSMLFLGLWITIWIAIFSFSHNKQEYYILPIYPAASLWLSSFLLSNKFGRFSALPAAFLVVFASLIMATAMTILAGPKIIWWLIMVPSLSFAVFIVQNKWKASVTSLSLCFLLAFYFYSEPLEDFRPIRKLAHKIETLENNREGPFQAGYFKFACPSLTFYLNQPILQLSEIEEAISALSAKKRTYLIVEKLDLQNLMRHGTSFYIVGTAPLLRTTLRNLIQILKSRNWMHSKSWTREIFLVSNSPID